MRTKTTILANMRQREIMFKCDLVPEETLWACIGPKGVDIYADAAGRQTLIRLSPTDADNLARNIIAGYLE